MKRTVSGTMLILLLTSILTLTFYVQPVKTEPVTIIVPDDYLTIQEAINAANSGDTIYVYNGTYYENVIANKSISLIGENRENTIINGKGNENTICVTASNVFITRFTICNGRWAGLRLDGIMGSNNNTIFYNSIINSGSGIVLQDSARNRILYNKIENNVWNGIHLVNVATFGNVINGNNITGHLNGINNHFADKTFPNAFFHNNFFYNEHQVFDYWNNSRDTWDDGYPSGGNYWSDYSGTDLFSGPYQNVTGSDCIGDTPYVIDENNQDRYPLMASWGATSYYDWPMFRHDPSHTGYSLSSAPNTNKVLWSYTTGGPVFSSPAVADGKVFIGSNDWNVYALNAFSGALLWSYATRDIVFSSPAVADGKVYVGSYDSRVYCLNASTGAQIWSYATGGRVESSPAVADGKVFVGSYDHNVYCLNASTGDFVWSFTTEALVDSSPAVVDGRVYVGSADHKLYALNASTGELMWNYTTNGLVFSSPAVANGKVFVGSFDERVYALNASTGELIWSRATDFAVCSSPAFADGKVYVGSYYGSVGNVYCLNASTGDFVWNYTTGAISWSSPAVVDGKVFVGSYDCRVYALNDSTGALVWSYTTEAYLYSSPAIANGKMYVGSADGKIYAFGPGHDVAATEVTPSKTVVGLGYCTLIHLRTENQGDFTENFNITVYANTTSIASQTITLMSGNSTTITFTWNTTGVAKGYYAIWAYAWPVPDETETIDNNCTFNGSVLVTIPGDVTSDTGSPDGRVDMRDIGALCNRFMTTPSNPDWNPNMDINDDGVVNMRDIGIACDNFMKT